MRACVWATCPYLCKLRLALSYKFTAGALASRYFQCAVAGQACPLSCTRRIACSKIVFHNPPASVLSRCGLAFGLRPISVQATHRSSPKRRECAGFAASSMCRHCMLPSCARRIMLAPGHAFSWVCTQTFSLPLEPTLPNAARKHPETAQACVWAGCPCLHE